MDYPRPHTTIGLKRTTKKRLDRGRAPGQCYDGFLCQLMDLWEVRERGGGVQPGEEKSRNQKKEVPV